MDTKPEELVAVLASFADATSPAVALARELAASPDAAITRSMTPVPSRNLGRIYTIRAGHSWLPAARLAEYTALAAAAAQFPDESWYIFTVAGGDSEVVVFAAPGGAGRFALDLSPR